MSNDVESYFFNGNGRVPNSRFPVLIYRKVIDSSLYAFEERLRRNGWPPDWHSALGMFPRHHFHSDAHELIAVTKGHMSGLFGGHDGGRAALEAGDVVVIPAGVGHYGESISEDLRLIGSFPAGCGVHDFRLCRPDEYLEMCERVSKVGIPGCDPIHGPGGPLTRVWRGI